MTLGAMLRHIISNFYLIIRYVCLAAMLILLIVLGIKAALTSIASEKARFKEMLFTWIVGLLVILYLHYFIYTLIMFNQAAVNKCKELGEQLSGINAYSSEDEYDEVTLYDTAVSKAYELKFSSGMLGMVMYIMLVAYTVMFFVVYARRYINIMILILWGPVTFTIHYFKKIIYGTSGEIVLWTKEIVYNIFIQTVHAFFYSLTVGLALRIIRFSFKLHWSNSCFNRFWIYI